MMMMWTVSKSYYRLYDTRRTERAESEAANDDNEQPMEESPAEHEPIETRITAAASVLTLDQQTRRLDELLGKSNEQTERLHRLPGKGTPNSAPAEALGSSSAAAVTATAVSISTIRPAAVETHNRQMLLTLK